jgi:hypothetical protein
VVRGGTWKMKCSVLPKEAEETMRGLCKIPLVRMYPAKGGRWPLEYSRVVLMRLEVPVTRRVA